MTSSHVFSLESVNPKGLRTLWQPYLRCMRVTMGLPFDDRSSWTPLKVYALFMVCVPWCIIAYQMCTTVYPHFQTKLKMDVETMVVVSHTLYCTQVAVSCTVIFCAFHQEQCMPRVFQMWTSLKIPYELNGRLEESVTASTRVTVFLLAVIVIVTQTGKHIFLYKNKS